MLNARIYFPRYAQVWKPLISEGYADYGADDSIFLRAMRRSNLPNLNMDAGELSQSGYEPVPIKEATDIDGLMRVALDLGEPNAIGLMAARGIFTVISERGKREPLAETSGWLVRKLRRVDGNLRASATLAAPDFDPRREAILSDGFPDDWQDGEDSDEKAGSVIGQGEQGSVWKWKVDAGDDVAFMVTPLTYYVGWRAEIDGKPTPVYRANLASIGLLVPAGKHEVVLSYHPELFRIGVHLGGAAWSVFVSWVVALWQSKRIHR